MPGRISPAPAVGRVIHDGTRASGPRAPDADQAVRWWLLRGGRYQDVADLVGFQIDRPGGPVASDQERYPTVTTPAGRTYAAQPWPDE